MVSTALATRYQYDYNRFADWCAAHGHTPIPADPKVIGEYLTSAPAAPSTQRSRLSAINWAHRNAGFPPPGRAPKLRESLNPTRAARTTRLHELIDTILPNLPVWGWPGGLFGRRDAALLHLARSGLPFSTIAELGRPDITIDTDHVALGTGPLVVLHASDEPALCPVAAFRRWVAVLDIVRRPTATYLLEHHLERRTLPDHTSAPTADDPAPLFFALDRDGNPALKPSPLTPGSIGVITATHILGRTPAHRPRKRRRDNENSIVPRPPADPDPPLGNEYFDRGTAARRRGLESMADIEALLDAAEAEADRVLAAWD